MQKFSHFSCELFHNYNNMTLANIFHYRLEFKDKIPTREPTKAPAKWQNITKELEEKIEIISQAK